VRRRARGLIIALAALAVAGVAGGCGSFDSKASGEHLIRDYVKRFGRGQVTLSSVSCPSGVAQKTGTAYTCKVKLNNVKTGRQASGTITVHIANGNKVEIQGAQDVHLGQTG
jgi:hypothetical protein